MTANDGANTTNKLITVTLTDVNDNAPVITTLAAQSVAENATLVAALTSTDADTVGTNPATFTITGGADQALFGIVSGNLVFLAGRDYETQAHSYQVQVTANDGANTTNKLITVTLTPVNDNPPIANPDAVTVDEGATATTLVGGSSSLLANDTDADLPDDVLTVDTTPVVGPSHGTLILAPMAPSATRTTAARTSPTVSPTGSSTPWGGPARPR